MLSSGNCRSEARLVPSLRTGGQSPALKRRCAAATRGVSASPTAFRRKDAIMTRPIIVFDLDGTLVDTAPDLLDSLNHSLDAGGVERTERRGFHRFRRPGRPRHDRARLRRAAEGAPCRGARPAVLAVPRSLRPQHSRPSQPYPGVLAALERFAEAGFLMAVCTNKPEGFSRSLLGGLGIDWRILPRSAAPTRSHCRKPDPRHLTRDDRDGRRGSAIAPSWSVIRDTDIDTAKASRHSGGRRRFRLYRPARARIRSVGRHLGFRRVVGRPVRQAAGRSARLEPRQAPPHMCCESPRFHEPLVRRFSV